MSDVGNPEQPVAITPPVIDQTSKVANPPAIHAEVPASVVEGIDQLRKSDKAVKKAVDQGLAFNPITGEAVEPVVSLQQTESSDTVSDEESQKPGGGESDQEEESNSGQNLQNRGEENPEHTEPGESNPNPGEKPWGALKNQKRQGPGETEPIEPTLPVEPIEPIEPIKTTKPVEPFETPAPIAPVQEEVVDSGEGENKVYMPYIAKGETGIKESSAQEPVAGENPGGVPGVRIPSEKVGNVEEPPVIDKVRQTPPSGPLMGKPFSPSAQAKARPARQGY